MPCEETCDRSCSFHAEHQLRLRNLEEETKNSNDTIKLLSEEISKLNKVLIQMKTAAYCVVFMLAAQQFGLLPLLKKLLGA